MALGLQRYSAVLFWGLLCCGCDTGSQSTSPPALDSGQVEMDGDQDRPRPIRRPGETCMEGECRRGACIHGVCSPLCMQDTDCGSETLRCLDREGARRCSRICTSTPDCEDGLLCAVSGPDVGFCVKPGEGVGGEMCRSRSDCASWRCTRGQCLASCDSMSCAAGSRCLELHTQKVCTPIGPVPTGGQCQFDAQCETGICRGAQCVPSCFEGVCPDDRVCIRYSSIDLCERRCATSEDCGDSAFCLLSGRQKICTTRGTEMTGGNCGRHEDCASGRCDEGRCAAECANGECSPGYACVSDVTGPLCRPAGPAPDGARCEQSDVCASGFCAAGQCAPNCDNEGGCPPSLRCTQFSNGQFCFAPCRTNEDCSPVAFCDSNFSEGPTCYWRGTSEPGQRCSGNRDCRSGYCDGQTCRSNCDDDADCAGQERCVSVGPTNICTSLPLPVNATCERSDACQAGTRCTAGRCLPDCATSCSNGAVCHRDLCQPPCENSQDCRPGRGCVATATTRPFCADPGPLEDGASCETSTDCRALLCLEGRCASRCGDCPETHRCLTTPGGSWCAPMGPGLNGSPCTTSDSCESALCLGNRCSAPCPEGACPADAECGSFSGAQRCVGTCRPGATDCRADELCTTSDGLTYQCVALESPTRGEVCEDDRACGADAPQCQLGPDGQTCRGLCNPLNGHVCELGETCVTDAANGPGTCLPTGENGLLESCDLSINCADGWCITTYLTGRCGRQCLSDENCGEGYCVDLARDPNNPLWTCANACSGNDECPSPLRCRQRLDGVSACY